MSDMTGWILRDRAWRNDDDVASLVEGDDLYLVLGPVPTRPPYERWTLMDMRSGRRLTIEDAVARNVFRYKRVA